MCHCSSGLPQGCQRLTGLSSPHVAVDYSGHLPQRSKVRYLKAGMGEMQWRKDGRERKSGYSIPSPLLWLSSWLSLGSPFHASSASSLQFSSLQPPSHHTRPHSTLAGLGAGLLTLLSRCLSVSRSFSSGLIHLGRSHFATQLPPSIHSFTSSIFLLLLFLSLSHTHPLCFRALSLVLPEPKAAAEKKRK